MRERNRSSKTMNRGYVISATAILVSTAIAATAFGTQAERAANPSKQVKKALKQSAAALAAANAAAATANAASSAANTANGTAGTALAATTGPAGGDLSGNYPAPSIAAGTIGIDELSTNVAAVRAYARINPDGTIVDANNIVVEAGGKVEKPATGVYCLDPTSDSEILIGNSSVVATPEFDSSSTNTGTEDVAHVEWKRNSGVSCSVPTDFQINGFNVDLASGDIEPANQAFSVLIVSAL